SVSPRPYPVMLRIGRKLIAEKYSTFNERLDQALRCTPVRRRHWDILDRSKPLLAGSDLPWRSAAIHRKRNSMMGEWKHRLINCRSLKTLPAQAARFEPRQDPHPTPSVAGLLEQNSTAPNDQCMSLDDTYCFGS